MILSFKKKKRTCPEKYKSPLNSILYMTVLMLKRKHVIEAKTLKDVTHRTAVIYLQDQVPQLL